MAKIVMLFNYKAKKYYPTIKILRETINQLLNSGMSHNQILNKLSCISTENTRLTNINRFSRDELLYLINKESQHKIIINK